MMLASDPRGMPLGFATYGQTLGMRTPQGQMPNCGMAVRTGAGGRMANIIRGSLPLPGAAWCGVVWCGVVWCGVVWCGVVWCAVLWCAVLWCAVACGVVHCVCARRYGQTLGMRTPQGQIPNCAKAVRERHTHTHTHARARKCIAEPACLPACLPASRPPARPPARPPCLPASLPPSLPTRRPTKRGIARSP
jgi:hypothetical protein